MKNFLLIILTFVVCVVFTSCTDNYRARNFGADITIDVPAGQKLIMTTWKEDELWYLTEPAEDGYVPKTKIFQESSSFGIMEGTVTFIEH